MFWNFSGRERNPELLADSGFVVDSNDVITEEIGGGDILFVRTGLE